MRIQFPNNPVAPASVTGADFKPFSKLRMAPLLALLFSVLCTDIFAQSFFSPVGAGNLARARGTVDKVKKKGVFQLNEQAMRSYLLRAPMEFRNNGAFLPLEIPLPDGTTETFNMVESPILSAKVAADHPEIKTYTGNGAKNKKAVIRLSLTSSGFNAIIMNVGDDVVYFESYSKPEASIYFNYYTKDVIIPKGMRVQSGGQDFIKKNNINLPRQVPGMAARPNDPPLAGIGTGTTLTTFRLALAADGEFTFRNGGTATSAFNALLAYVNRLNAFYRNELSVGFTLVSGTNLVYTDSTTDPYNSNDQNLQLIENQTNVDAVIGSANYDIGHVMGFIGSTGGGLAALNSVCNNENKAQGLSYEGDPDVITQVINDKLIFHEVGHQFGMTHSYNSSVPVCTSREPETSVEPGAGITVMSYAMICFDNDFDYIGDDYYVFMFPENRALLQLHNVSYQQAVAFMQTIQPYPAGVIVTNTGNTPPVIVMPPNVTIPKSTPFALTGTASDGNGDALTFDWEGTDTGGDAANPPDANTLANTAMAPFSRTYAPANTPTRIFPIIDSILSGANYARADKLPSVTTAVHYNLTVRDNNPAGGGVNYGSVTVNVDGNIGPFLETTNLSGTYAGNSNQTITWSVLGTNTATPNVKISLSTDGGYTFPTVLAMSTPNDGSQTITLPNITTSNARIKVEAVDNIFFDISNVNFSISPAVVNYIINASAGANGSISPGGAVSVPSGNSKSFIISANAGFHVANVVVDNVSVGAVTSYNFTNVTANHTIVASFAGNAVNYIINASAGANGSISPVGAVSVASGNSKSFTITANAGFHVANVLVDNASVGAVTSYNFTNVTANHTIVASFLANTGCTPPGLSAVVTNVSCKGSNTGAINLSTSGGSAPFTYLWTGPNSFYATSQDITARIAGSYKVVVTAAGGCTSAATYNITEPTAVLSVSAVPGIINCKDGKTNVVVTATGGTAPYTGTGTITNQPSGAHTYKVTDARGCTASKTINIAAGPAIPAAPFIIGQWFNLCGGGTFTFFVYPPAGNKSYTWVVPPGFSIVSGQGTPLVKIKVPANFTTQAIIKVSATNSCGTGPQGSITVYAVAGNLSSVIAGPTSVTAGKKNVQFSLPSCSAFTYTWSVPTGATITSGQGTPGIVVKFGSASGYVKVIVKNSCGSSPQASKYVSVSPSLADTKATSPVETSPARAFFQVYPNPVAGNATVVFSSPKQNSKFAITVSDIMGKTLFVKTGATVAGQTTAQFDMNNYASGLYMVTLIVGDITQTLKLVKAK